MYMPQVRAAAILVAGLFWLFAGATRVAAQSDRPRVLVHRIDAVGVEQELARTLEDALVLALGRKKSLMVVSPAEMEQTVSFAKTQSELGCDLLEACAAEIEQKLRVQRIVTGKVSRLANEYWFTLGMLDLQSKTVGKRVARNAVDVKELLASLPSALDELLGHSQPAPEFRLQASEQLKLAVTPLVARGVRASTADSMTQILASELNQIDGITVISRDDIRAMLDKVTLEGELGCTANMQCIVEIGAALGLAKLVIGTVGKVKNTYIVATQLVDVRRAEVQNRVLESFEGDADELKHVVKLSAYQLAGVDYGERKGRVDFTFNVEDASVRLGTRELSIAHHRLEVADLAPGRYSLRVLADQRDFYPLQTDVYVAPNADNVRTFRVGEKPGPWFSKWWVWTVGGVVVASAAVSTALLIAAAQPNGSGKVSFDAR